MLREGVRLPGENDNVCQFIRFGNAKGVAFPVDDEHAHPGTAQFGVTGLSRLSRRVQRERERDDADRADRARGAAGDPGPV